VAADPSVTQISISEFTVLKDRRNKTSQLAKIAIREIDFDKIEIAIRSVHLVGHASNIKETIGVSATGVLSRQRNLESQVAKS
jgi:hypothetical protein